ncbi:MAG TPA: recombinase family protein [Mycobacteriales bacterium]|nr:recombinase family protein [Mycobacteriales bacterium]
MRAAVYARLSRRKADAELGVNIGDQQKTGKALVETRGWTLIPGPDDGTFTDDGRGAYQDDAKRPRWKEMLAERPDVIIVRDVERLGRNHDAYYGLVNSKARVIAWLSDETGDIDWNAPLRNPDTYEFGNAMLGSREFSRKIGAKVANKIRVKAASGAWPHGGTRPFGYHHSCCRDDRGSVVCEPGTVVEAEAEIIREIAARWLAGESLSSMCRDLNQRGITTPADKPWQYARLRSMLAGPRIAGIRTHKGIETKGQWEAIVDEHLHRRLLTAASESMTKRANANGTYLLTSVVRCATCGGTMWGTRLKMRDENFRTRYICHGGDRGGCGQGIAAPRVDQFVTNRSFMSIIAPELRNQEEMRRELERFAAEVADMEDRIAELDLAYWQDRTITKDRWSQQSAMLASSLDGARKNLADVKRGLAQSADAPSTAQALVERWLGADTRERNRLLRIGVDHVRIHPPAVKGGRFDPSRIEIHFRDGRIYRLEPGAAVPDDADAVIEQSMREHRAMMASGTAA